MDEQIRQDMRLCAEMVWRVIDAGFKGDKPRSVAAVLRAADRVMFLLDSMGPDDRLMVVRTEKVNAADVYVSEWEHIPGEGHEDYTWHAVINNAGAV